MSQHAGFDKIRRLVLFRGIISVKDAKKIPGIYMKDCSLTQNIEMVDTRPAKSIHLLIF